MTTTTRHSKAPKTSAGARSATQPTDTVKPLKTYSRRDMAGPKTVLALPDVRAGFDGISLELKFIRVELAAIKKRLEQREAVAQPAPIEALISPADQAATSVFLAAKSHALAMRKQLVAAGELVTSGDITARMHMSRQALSKAVNANRLFALQLQDEQYYPAFFADEHISRADLGRVCKVLGVIDNWEKYMFFTRANGALDKLTPLQALRHDQIESVLKAAASFAR